MPTYKSKPLVVEAFSLGIDPYPDWFTDNMNSFEYDNLVANGGRGVWLMQMNNSRVWVKGGDYICRNQYGDIYAKSEYAFRRTHDAI